MKYRVVLKSDDRYYLQYRSFLFFWEDSSRPSFGHKATAIAEAVRCTVSTCPPRIVREIWPHVG